MFYYIHLQICKMIGTHFDTLRFKDEQNLIDIHIPFRKTLKQLYTVGISTAGEQSMQPWCKIE